MKTKRHYTSPVTHRATVELEGGFCGSIANTHTIESRGHEVGGDYTFNVKESTNSDGVLTQEILNDFGGTVTWE